MNANLVKYGKYGAIALVAGLVAYTLVQKGKKAKAELAAKELADAAAKKIADDRAKTLATAAANKAGAAKNYAATNPLPFNPARATMVDSQEFV
jgi:hypothetical protein